MKNINQPRLILVTAKEWPLAKEWPQKQYHPEGWARQRLLTWKIIRCIGFHRNKQMDPYPQEKLIGPYNFLASFKIDKLDPTPPPSM